MRVLQPVVDRTYDPNPQGSATTTVMMAAAMPFQRTVRVTRYGSQPANVAGLGDATSDATDQMNADAAAYNASVAADSAASKMTAPSAQPVSAPQSTSLLDQIATGLTKAGTTLVQGAATRVANRLTGATAAAPARTGVLSAGGPSWVLIGGVAAVAGLGLWFMMRKPAHAVSRRRRR